MLIEINPKGEEFYKEVKCAEDVLIEVEKYLGSQAASYLRETLEEQPLERIKRYVNEIEAIVIRANLSKEELVSVLYRISLILEEVEK